MTIHAIALPFAAALIASIASGAAQAQDIVKTTCFIGTRVADSRGTLERGWMCLEERAPARAADAAVEQTQPVRTAKVETPNR